MLRSFNLYQTFLIAIEKNQDIQQKLAWLAKTTSFELEYIQKDELLSYIAYLFKEISILISLRFTLSSYGI